MVREVFPGVYQFRDIGVSFYLLKNEGLGEEGGLILLDGGFLRGLGMLRTWLEKEGHRWTDIRAIMMTHGHLDHTFNIAEIRELSGAKVYGHAEEKGHFLGQGVYEGLNHVCGWGEGLGRWLLGYEAFVVTEEIEDGQVLDEWGGLQVVHLPGHTAGHCGYFSKQKGILFSGDSHASYAWGAVKPPKIFNWDAGLVTQSIEKADALKPKNVFANHCDLAGGEVQAERLECLGTSSSV